MLQCKKHDKKEEVDKTDEQTRKLKNTINDLQLRIGNLEKRMVFSQNLCFLFSFSFIKVLFLLSYKGVLGATSCFALIHSLFVKSLIFDSSIRYVIWVAFLWQVVIGVLCFSSASSVLIYKQLSIILVMKTLVKSWRLRCPNLLFLNVALFGVKL